MTNIEKRLINTERALVAFYSLIEDNLTTETKEAVSKMMEEYFDSNVSLGGNFDSNFNFLKKEENNETV
jgi:arylsulfatase A-like enzyme